MTVVGWDISRCGSPAVTSTLTRDNAPALPWVDGIDQVELTGHRSVPTTKASVLAGVVGWHTPHGWRSSVPSSPRTASAKDKRDQVLVYTEEF